MAVVRVVTGPPPPLKVKVEVEIEGELLELPGADETLADGPIAATEPVEKDEDTVSSESPLVLVCPMRVPVYVALNREAWAMIGVGIGAIATE